MDYSTYHATPVAVVLLFLTTCHCQEQTFYIRPSDSSYCPQEVNASQCYDLTTLVSEGHLSTAPNTSLSFLPGEHFLEHNLDIKNTKSFKMIPYTEGESISLVFGVEIICNSTDSGHSIRIENVSFVKIDSISFQSCGVDANNSGVLQLRSVDHSEIINSKWYESRSSGIFIEDSNTVISDCHLMSGSCSNCQGGGIRANSSNVTLTGNTAVTKNSVLIWHGGGLSLTSSNVHVNGTLIVDNNMAGFAGGGVFIDNCYCTFNTSYLKFENNIAQVNGGGISVFNSQCSFNGLSGNSAAHGGGIAISNRAQCIVVSMALFSNNSARKSGGSLFTQLESNFTFLSLVNISSNTAGNEGGGILVKDDSLLVMSGEIVMNDNYALSFGGAISLYFSKLQMGGSSIITSNSAQYGGALYTTSSKVYILGSHRFENNNATFGGGWSLSGSLIYFSFMEVLGDNVCLSAKLNIQFISNHAEQYGGAVWVENSPYYSCRNDKSDSRCFIRYDDPLCLFGPYGVSAVNNTAIAGNNIYGGNIDSCSEDIKDYLLLSFLNESNSVSSDPYRVCICNKNEPDCSISDHHIEAFTGQQIQITLVGVGERNGTVPVVILSHIDPPGSSSLTQSAPGSCSELFYTINSDNSSVQLLLYPETVCLQSSLSMLTVHINIKPCPPGFMLNNETKSCVCDNTLKELDNSIQCDINSQSFTHQHGVWIGYDEQNGNVLYHPHCPFDYCTQELSTFTLNSTDNQCRYNRSGLICGACSEGLTLTLGKSKCRMCSRMYFALFLPLALAGVLLVLFLYIFDLTVSVGTINGLLFFANIIGTNSSVFLPLESAYFLRVFIAWLNLDLGIDTCLFDGLDMYGKAWLQFVFPFYIYILIAIIIILNRRHSTHRDCFIIHRLCKCKRCNSGDVIATLILLANTKLIRAVFTVISFTYIRELDGSKYCCVVV